MTDTTPTPADRPADQLRAAAERARETGDPLHTALAEWLVVEADVIAARAAQPEGGEWAVDIGGDHALAVARQLLDTSEGAGVTPSADRRARYAAAIREADGWVLDDGQHMIDAVMAVADAEQTELHAQIANLRTMYNVANDRTNDLIDERDKLLEAAVAPPAPADRAAVLREAVEVAGQMGGRFGTDDHGDIDTGWNDACEAIATELRRLAADAATGVQPTTTEAHPPVVEYIAEVLELDGAWEYLGAHADPTVAARRRASVTRRYPDAETRTVRKTTTYTVEPEPAAPAAPEETQ
ncbi:hypothetical protein GA0115253_100458 [Streptomyces sp. Termitarium-T10T-6]|nr:hypothetical protein [Streptomyces sp. Termitarium-T10T-6]SCD42724.1 hypothetical protein GA0115253_100458 [Streptomyces sp. Termitarium-T10T-6]